MLAQALGLGDLRQGPLVPLSSVCSLLKPDKNLL